MALAMGRHQLECRIACVEGALGHAELLDYARAALACAGSGVADASELHPEALGLARAIVAHAITEQVDALEQATARGDADGMIAAGRALINRGLDTQFALADDAIQAARAGAVRTGVRAVERGHELAGNVTSPLGSNDRVALLTLDPTQPDNVQRLYAASREAVRDGDLRFARDLFNHARRWRDPWSALAACSLSALIAHTAHTTEAWEDSLMCSLADWSFCEAREAEVDAAFAAQVGGAWDPGNIAAARYEDAALNAFFANSRGQT